MKEFIAILKNELVKTIKRPRSFIGFGVVAFICLILQAAFYNDGREILSLVTGQLENSLSIEGNILNGNLVCFVLLQTLIIQMPLLVALVTGDLVSGEVANGTMRFLLTRPASRTKILVAKWLAGMFYTLLLLIFLGVLALFLSRALFGVNDLIYVNSEALTVLKANDLNWRFAGAFVIAFLSLSVVATLAHFLSTVLDNSITPIVSTMAIVIIFTIIGMFDMPSFNVIQPFLFTTHMISWKDMFEDPIPKQEIIKSCIILFAHIVLLLGSAVYIFNRKDINS